MNLLSYWEIQNHPRFLLGLCCRDEFGGLPVARLIREQLLRRAERPPLQRLKKIPQILHICASWKVNRIVPGWGDSRGFVIHRDSRSSLPTPDAVCPVSDSRRRSDQKTPVSRPANCMRVTWLAGLVGEVPLIIWFQIDDGECP